MVAMAQDTQTRESATPLLTRIRALEEAGRRKVIRTRSRRTKISSEFVGHTLAIFNGRDFHNVRITDEMVGRTLAKVAPRDRATARSTFLSIPPRKMRLVGDLVKGLPVDKALNILNFTPRIAAVHMAKTLKSAVANMLSVEGTSNLHPEDLHIKRIVVDEAPTAKRIKFQSMGRVFRIRKRFCHLSIFLDASREALAAAPVPTRGKKAKGKADADAAKAPKKTASAKKKAAAKSKAKLPGAKKKGGSKGAGKGFAKGASKTTAKVTKSTKDR